MLLEDLGFHVIEAKDGLEVLIVLKTLNLMKSIRFYGYYDALFRWLGSNKDHS